MIITEQYAHSFCNLVAGHSPVIDNFVNNCGYIREFDGGVRFTPENHKCETSYSIGLTPCLNQSTFDVYKDISMGRMLLVAEALNFSGDYTILEDDTKYMVLTGYIMQDLNTYCRRVAKVIAYVTDSSKNLGMIPHDFIARISN